jgi:hypothetical protein
LGGEAGARPRSSPSAGRRPSPTGMYAFATGPPCRFSRLASAANSLNR